MGNETPAYEESNNSFHYMDTSPNQLRASSNYSSNYCFFAYFISYFIIEKMALNFNY